MIIKNRKKIYLEQVDKQFPKAAQDEQKQQKIELLNSLENFEKKYSGQHVRATLMQLQKGENPHYFDPEYRKVLRNNCLVECSHFIETNWKYDTAGKLYILDEEATEKNIEGMEAHKTSIAEKAALEAEVGEEVANTIKQIGQVAKAKATAKPSNNNGQQVAKAKEDITAELTQKIADANEAGDTELAKSLQVELDKVNAAKVGPKKK